MKKIVILVIVLSLVSVGFLSGCSSNTTKKTPQELIIGSWTRTDGRLLQFYSNNSYYVHYNTTSYWSTYSINDTSITLIILGRSYSGTYLFKNNNNTLELTDSSGSTKTYTRN